MSERMKDWAGPARSWWRRVCSDVRGDPAARARLRRTRDRVDAFLVADALALAKTLEDSGRPEEERFGTALDLARVLSHVREDINTHPMRSVGWRALPSGKADEEKPRLSETRFRRFLLATDGEERVDAFVRLIHLMDGRANVGEIADAFQWWSDPEGRVRKSWAFSYYNAAGFTPGESTEIPSEETVQS
jgi:CRISPR type I-E-associated protein CasB/Cse2